VRVCAFDLDHTLVRSPLDLAAMAADMRALLERSCGPLPARPERYRVGELVAWCQHHSPDLESRLWEVALDHERRALLEAELEPGALEAVRGARAAGFRTALWTNNAREVTLAVLERFALARELDVAVSRDEMARLKPDPAGWKVIADYFGAVGPAVVVGDSWVDGVAAAAAGIPFVAYRASQADLDRWRVTPIARLEDLAALPAWLSAYRPDGPGS
jgi:phosphoglycolate phosphatase-like HAD superfamily hydrolase